uniref:Uncharacterized protein n=1 Tax=Rhizophora mucronata TaxID=61149 RepID=A0A2P2R3Y9_RHIMU
MYELRQNKTKNKKMLVFNIWLKLNVHDNMASQLEKIEDIKYPHQHLIINGTNFFLEG